MGLFRPLALTSIAHARALAARRLPKSVHVYVEGGREQGDTVRRNLEGFRNLTFRPRVAVHHPERVLETTILGRPAAMPVVISPTGFIRLAHPDGEVAAARAARSMGIPIGISTLSSHPLEAITAASPDVWFQLYMIGGRTGADEMIARAKAAGCQALIVTVDRSAGSGQDWPMREVPARIDLATALAYLPEVIWRPRWALDFLRGGFTLAVPNLPRNATGGQTTLAEAAASLGVSPPTWADIAWMRARWAGPLVVKGVMTGEDALRAIDAGADAVSVSNHGGNCLDGLPASIEALPEVVAAAAGRVEVFLDGGVRRGADVVRAVALGARAVLIGRPTIWGLACGGEEGVRQVLAILRNGIDSTLSLLGCRSVAELEPSFLNRPGQPPAR